MKKNYYQLRSYMAIAATTFFIASCSKDTLVDSMNGDNSSFQSVDFSENGTNPDDAGLTIENAKFATNGYLYTESNDASLNSIIM